MTLYYIDENIRIHLGKVLDISEANCYRNIKELKILLIKNLDFQLTLLVKSTIKWLILMTSLHYLLKNCKYFVKDTTVGKYNFN
ncbi:hypothetical protein [Spiroplasma poulsonii]|uniref:hypothetical protein n=1 Tax=Spiroplasma poulsonii TaxID=2138 RepID=UPI001F4C7FD9|nr:hypothetical protein [Spiroplasma poulsonii]UNF62228.1 hypothetical protein MNU24_01860 [Spiroplasma poulsonii]